MNKDKTNGSEKILHVSDKWDEMYREAVVAAIRKYSDDPEEVIYRYLSFGRRTEFNLTNTYARAIFRLELLQAWLDLEKHIFRRGIVVMWASIADHDWACCDRKITFDYQIAKQKIRNAFVGRNFIGVIEPGYYPEVGWETDDQAGSLISFHAHIVVWDTSKSKLRRHQLT